MAKSPFQLLAGDVTKRMASDRKLLALLNRAAKAKSPESLRTAMNGIGAILNRSAVRTPCSAQCWREYLACSRRCTDTSCITRCFGRYVVCMRNCK
jgi:hypothetical protein